MVRATTLTSPSSSTIQTAEDLIVQELLATREAYDGRELDPAKDPNIDYDANPPPIPTHLRGQRYKRRKVIDGEWGIWEDKGGMEKITTFLEMQIKDPNPYQRHQYEMTMSAIPIFTQWTYGIPWTKLNLVAAMRQCGCPHACPVVTIIVRRQAGKTEWGVRFFGAALIAFSSDDPSNPATYLLKSHIKGSADGNLLRMQDWLLTKPAKYLAGFNTSSLAKNGNLICAGKIELTNKHNPKDIRRAIVPTVNIDGKTKVRMYGDEFMKWREDAATSQILPMLQASATFILTSALKDPKPWAISWLSKADGQLVFLLNKAEICMKCLENLTLNNASDCQHQRGVQAGFIDSEKLAQTAKMMNPIAAMAELMSVFPTASGAIFQEKDLRLQLMRVHPGDLNPETQQRTPPVFDDYVAYCDPSMGSAAGAGSESCVAIAGFRTPPGSITNSREIVLLSLSHQPTPSTTEIVGFVVKCLRDFFEVFHHKSPILQRPGRRKAYIYLSVEMQSVPHTREIALELAKYPKMAESIIFIKSILGKAKRSNHEYGIMDKSHWLHLRGGQGKSANDETRYAGAMHNWLRSGLWSVHPEMITSNIHRTPKLALEAALQQFLHVHVVKPPGEKEKVVSGKTAGGKAAMNDIWITLSTMVSNVYDLVTSGERFHAIFESGKDLLSNLQYYTNQIEVLSREEDLEEGGSALAA